MSWEIINRIKTLEQKVSSLEAALGGPDLKETVQRAVDIATGVKRPTLTLPKKSKN